jgi:hypothetical protein
MMLQVELPPLHDLGVKVLLAALQEERERGPFTELAIHGERATMKLRELTSQRESDPHSALLAALGGLGLMEALEDPLLLIACNPGTGIGHFDRRSGRVVEYADLNPTPSGCEFHRVPNEIREDDLDAVRIAVSFGGRAIGVEHQIDVLRPRGRHRIFCDATGQVAWIELHDPQAQSARLQPSQVQQVVDHPQQPRCVPPNDLQRIPLRAFSSSASTGDKINVSGVRNS